VLVQEAMEDSGACLQKGTRPRRVPRYKNFDPTQVKIHPLKRLASRLASCLPRSWRFFITGLPVYNAEAAIPGEVDSSSSLFSLSGGIACQLGAHLTPSGACIPPLTPGAGPFIETRFLQKQRCFPKIRTVTGTVASLVQDGQMNYYRWLMEVLPRMRYLKEKEINCDWFYACQRHPFHREGLRLLAGVDARIIDCEQTPYLRARQFLVPRFIEEEEEWIIPWLREQFLPHVPAIKDELRPRRLYITRDKATGRRAANRKELLDLLGSYGFTPMIMEDHSWLSQLAFFQGAKAIVAPHGAGLANLIFCSSSTLVVELIAKDYPFTFYPEISHRLKLDHHLIPCTPLHPLALETSDIEVPLDQVESLLKAALS